MSKDVVKDVLDAGVRRVISMGCLLLSGLAFYRGYSYEDPMGPFIVGQVMCLGFGFNLAVVGVYLGLRPLQRNIEPA